MNHDEPLVIESVVDGVEYCTVDEPFVDAATVTLDESMAALEMAALLEQTFGADVAVAVARQILAHNQRQRMARRPVHVTAGAA